VKTDTHGWLEGHLKDANYGADWGDFVSFTETLKNQADSKGADLLIIDTGQH
jgi:2',3'-cyclic-nucleotide 2'-phosphodiesterase (5'-nucleotidase family)